MFDYCSLKQDHLLHASFKKHLKFVKSALLRRRPLRTHSCSVTRLLNVRCMIRTCTISSLLSHSYLLADKPKDNPDATPDAMRTLFVGRLAYETTEETLRKELGEFGTVTNVCTMRQ